MLNENINYEKCGHHILVSSLKGRIKITVDGITLAESTNALELKEDGYEKVYYIPLKDVKAEVIRSETRTTCPYKGNASYYSMKLNIFHVLLQFHYPGMSIWMYMIPHL